MDYYGVGGHGGVGKNADREQRNNEIVALVARQVDPSSYFLMNIDRITDNDPGQRGNAGSSGGGAGSKLKKNILSTLKPLRGGTSYYNHVDEANAAGSANNNNNATGGGPGLGHRNSAFQVNSQNRQSMRESVNNRAGLTINQSNNPNGQNNGENQQNQADVPKCAVCTLL